MTQKITNEERELLIQKKFERLDKSYKYRKDSFKTYFKEEELQENLDEWAKMSDKEKIKIVKQMQKMENKAVSEAAAQFCGRLNIKAQLEYLKNFKHNQLVEFGIRKDEINKRNRKTI